MHPMLNIATRTAHTAGEFIRRQVANRERLHVQHKSAQDFVTEVDRQTEYAIVQALRKSYPEHAILGEEGGLYGDADAEYQWIVDPLDGTTNFIYGMDHFAVSIALKQKGRLLLGVVYDPVRDELFAAHRGSGATLNGRRIRVSERLSMQGALLGTGMPFRNQHNLDRYLDTLRVLTPDTAGVRRMGAASLDLAYVACGRFDGFWEFELHEWDIAAGVLLIQEAGGLVGDLQGGHTHLQSGDVLAASPKVFKEMSKRLRPIINQSI